MAKYIVEYADILHNDVIEGGAKKYNFEHNGIKEVRDDQDNITTQAETKEEFTLRMLGLKIKEIAIFNKYNEIVAASRQQEQTQKEAAFNEVMTQPCVITQIIE